MCCYKRLMSKKKKPSEPKPLDTLTMDVEGGRATFYINERGLPELLRSGFSKSPNKKALRQEASFIGLFPEFLACILYDNPSGIAEGCEVAVMICKCGTRGCCDVLTTITVEEDTVTWHGLRAPIYGDMAELGPYRFAKDQYKELMGVSPDVD